jgi:predicted esterase YcpF (UPF0227 family)
MASQWDAAKAKAQQILGKDAKIPDPKFLPKLQAEHDAAFNAYSKARDELEAKLLEMQKAWSNGKLTVKQFADKLDDEDFGLDAKNKDDAKKLKDAHAIFAGWAQNVADIADTNISGLEDLDKHLIDFKKYKPKQG